MVVYGFEVFRCNGVRALGDELLVAALEQAVDLAGEAFQDPQGFASLRTMAGSLTPAEVPAVAIRANTNGNQPVQAKCACRRAAVASFAQAL